MIDGVPIESTIAAICRVCVAIFIFLSGYGVNETMNKQFSLSITPIRTLLRTSARLLWKLWAGYIVVFLLFVPWQGLFDRHPYTSFLDLFWDIAGLSYITGTPSMNATWWFMSAALFSYGISPIFKIVLTKNKTLLLALVPLFFLLYLFLGSVFWSYAFLLGMIASELSLLNILKEKFAQFKPAYVWSVCGCLVCTTAIIRYSSPTYGDFPLALSIVITSFLCVSKIPVLCTVLEFIGKHSANIFFFHSFIYLYNFKTIVYAPSMLR